jgi:3-dehydroquinate synthase
MPAHDDALPATLLATCRDSLARAGLTTHAHPLRASERTKTISCARDLLLSLGDHRFERRDLLIALGGGIVGDLAGFAAATFARGLEFFQVPTTLLAQVDSSVGGKVGVNLPGGKNMVGAFWQPRGVLIDVGVLQSLPEREYRAGLAEVVKYGVILDADFFAYLESHVEAINRQDAAVLTHIIDCSCRLKTDVVEKDERETTGLRAVLNYGHTFGHAFEALGDYEELLHGEAIAAGMRCAIRLAARLGRIDDATVARHNALLDALHLTTEPPEADGQELLRLMYRDKKTASGRLRFILPDRIGHVELVDDVSEEDVLAALEV